MISSVPLPTSLCTRSVPPWASAIVFTIERPRPCPEVSPWRLASERANRSKIVSRVSGGIPLPQTPHPVGGRWVFAGFPDQSVDRRAQPVGVGVDDRLVGRPQPPLARR